MLKLALKLAIGIVILLWIINTINNETGKKRVN